MRRQRFGWSIAGRVYGLSSECLEVSASVNHLSCSICVRIWCFTQDLCRLSPYPPTLWCICVLKKNPSVSVSWVQITSMCHPAWPVQVFLARGFLQFHLDPDLNRCFSSACCSPRGLLFFLFEATVFTHHHSTGSFDGWGVDFILLPSAFSYL